MNSAVKQIFDKMSEVFERPLKSFDEYERLVSSASEEFFDLCRVAKVEYSLVLSSKMLFIENAPDNTVLYSSELQCTEEVVHFSYPIYGGEVRFAVYPCEIISDLGRENLELVIRQFLYVLEGLVLELSCQELIMSDYAVRIPNITAYMYFAENLVSRKEIGEYTAIYFNIHNFKSIYKELTYIEGNEALAEYCAIIKNAISKREIVSRLGGDNFIALILNDNVDYFLDLIQNVVMRYRKNGEEFTFCFGATIGASKLSEATQAGDIIIEISSAYQHARANRKPLEYFEPYINSEIMERKNVLSRFQKALADGEFYAVYQPKVDVKTRNLIGAEALVRWRTNDGHSMPNSFISILEADGCITALDFYMLEEVCKLLSKLIEEGIEPVKISVNFSKLHLSNNKLVEEIVEVIDKYNLPHGYIEIELTESEDFHNKGIMEAVVDELGNSGIVTSMDDFGTGYSSLGLLKNLSIDILKIDRSFIPPSPIDKNDKSCLVFNGVVSLAKNLGLEIVVEGVETLEQLELVESMGCDIVQGYIFDKPLIESDFIDRIMRKTYSGE